MFIEHEQIFIKKEHLEKMKPSFNKKIKNWKLCGNYSRAWVYTALQRTVIM